jgi:hypothetical protein
MKSRLWTLISRLIELQEYCFRNKKLAFTGWELDGKSKNCYISLCALDFFPFSLIFLSILAWYRTLHITSSGWNIKQVKLTWGKQVSCAYNLLVGLANFSTLKMEAVCCFETSSYHTVCQHILQVSFFRFTAVTTSNPTFRNNYAPISSYQKLGQYQKEQQIILCISRINLWLSYMLRLVENRSSLWISITRADW